MGAVLCPGSQIDGDDVDVHMDGMRKKKVREGSNTSSRQPYDHYTSDPTRPVKVDRNGASSSSSAGGAKSTVSMHAIDLLIAEGKTVVKAQYDYTPTSTDPPEGSNIPDLAFKVNDIMEVLNEDGDWWLARHLHTGQQGYVPNTYVVPFSGLNAFDWYHGEINKKEVEKLLTAPGIQRGTFLVRSSETRPGSYALSLTEIDYETGRRIVKHYRINNMDNGGYYIAPRKTFSNLDELIRHYSEVADELSFKLTTPCPRQKPQMWDLSRETKDKWEIPRQEITLIEQLGAGNFGEVWRGKWKGKTDVAVKTMKEGTMTPEKFLEEAEIMKKLRHPRLVTLFAVCTREQPIYIVTELMPGGSLLSYLRTNKNLPIDQLIDIAAQVADGMRYIEKERHIHRDLAARNVLVGEDCRCVKIGDFGLARVIEEECYEISQGAKFPVKWTSPEAIRYGQYTIKSDVWAFGILLVEVTSNGSAPYPGMRNEEVMRRLENGYRHPKPAQCPDSLYEVMKTCWKTDPQERPTFEYLFETLDDFSVSTEGGYKEPTGY